MSLWRNNTTLKSYLRFHWLKKRSMLLGVDTYLIQIECWVRATKLFIDAAMTKANKFIKHAWPLTAHLNVAIYFVFKRDIISSYFNVINDKIMFCNELVELTKTIEKFNLVRTTMTSSLQRYLILIRILLLKQQINFILIT